jgi:cellulose biosynthesis protein BcsQ
VRTIAVYNIKGGVGKTATAVNLAHLSSAAGARTLIWDLDPQGAATFYFRVKPRIRGGIKKLMWGKKKLDRFVRGTDYGDLDLLPADFSNRNLDLVLDATKKPAKRMAKRIRPLTADYDHLYIDCAPSISLVSEGVFHAADVLLVPVIPTTLSLRALEQLLRHLKRDGPRKLRVLPFFCMVDRRKTMHREISSRKSIGKQTFLETRVPYSSQVEQMGAHRAPLAVYAGECEAAKAYESLWQEVLDRTGSWLGGFSLGRFRF